MCDRAPTHHFNHLQDPEVRLEVVHVAPDPPEHVPGVDGLGGGLVGAAGPGDHGRVGGLGVEALRLLGGPHDADGFRGGSWTLDRGLLRHIITENRAVWRRAHCVPCRLEAEVDGEDEPDSPLFIASFPAGEKTSSRGGCPSSCSRTSSAGKSGWGPRSLRCCLRATDAACLPQTAALTTPLGGSLVRVPVSLRRRGRFWLNNNRYAYRAGAAAWPDPDKHGGIVGEKAGEGAFLFAIVNLMRSVGTSGDPRAQAASSCSHAAAAVDAGLRGCGGAGLSPPLWKLHILVSALRQVSSVRKHSSATRVQQEPTHRRFWRLVPGLFSPSSGSFPTRPEETTPLGIIITIIILLLLWVRAVFFI